MVKSQPLFFVVLHGLQTLLNEAAALWYPLNLSLLSAVLQNMHLFPFLLSLEKRAFLINVWLNCLIDDLTSSSSDVPPCEHLLSHVLGIIMIYGVPFH